MKAKNTTISHDEVQKALRAFEKRGGLINKLPAQVAIGQTLVGSKWSMYETGDDTGSDSDAVVAN